VFHLPDLGEGLTDAVVVDWRVAVGDPVEVDQVVAEVETAKAVVEVPCPHAGTVARLHAEAGATLAVGAPLISVDPAGDPFAVHREEERAGSGAVLIGFGTGHGARRRRARVVRGGATPAAPPAAPPAAVARPTAPRPPAPRVLSPLVRRLARERGVDLAAVVPSGPGGVVTRADVVAAAAAPATAPATAPVPAAPAAALATAPAAAPPAAAPAPPAPDGVRVPLTGLRGLVAERLSRSRREIPEATTWVDVDATGLLAARDALRRARPDERIGLLALLARICVAGLRRFPELNATVDVERGEIVQLPQVHLGLAAQTPRGLVVPVVRDAGSRTTAELGAEVARLTERARAGALSPAELTGGTFTLNNYGVFGVDGSTPIINHPEAAILGVGRIIERPWVVDGAVVPRSVTQLSLAFDHRVCDGGVAGGFLRYVADQVEQPLGLLADL
jgi:pyruvate dehydrogenase E2 component (dihydrolipoamide acetyltransferase)